MKLIGAELTDFACFDRQFVPLRGGMTVLVGRNNSGKTALLRGLSTLQSLPIGEPTQRMPTDPKGYFRQGQMPGIELLCELEEADLQYFNGANRSHLNQLRESALGRWQFTITPSGLLFQKCRVDLPWGNQTVDLLLNDAGRGFVQTVRIHDLQTVSKRQISNRVANGGPVFDRGTPLSGPLGTVGNVKLVSPHRVVHETQLLQTTEELPSGAENLAAYLQTLNGQHRETFLEIEKFVTTVFPEFKYVNAASRANNQVTIELTESTAGRKIPLANSGTGVEQILTIATFVLTTPAPGLILLDEPHSYLHPVAERALVRFLEEHQEHKYVISTHSSVLINSVKPDHIVHVSPPGQPYGPDATRAEVSKVLFDLGYQNSDSLFHDRLIFVEGKSDAAIIPLLLAADGEISENELARTGFPELEGVGEGARALQTSTFRYEKLLSAMGRTMQRRVYLFDGDRKNDEKNVLRKTISPATRDEISSLFLARLEIENYLLAPDAISIAINEEKKLKGEAQTATGPEIQALLDDMFQQQPDDLFPHGKGQGPDASRLIKGSRALAKIYDKFGLYYHKERSGILIARHISAKNQPVITEIADLVRPLFAKAS